MKHEVDRESYPGNTPFPVTTRTIARDASKKKKVKAETPDEMKNLEAELDQEFREASEAKE